MPNPLLRLTSLASNSRVIRSYAWETQSAGDHDHRGQTVRPQYAGGAPGLVAGLMQINVQIPSGIQTGNAVPVVVQVGGASSQPGVTIAVQ